MEIEAGRIKIVPGKSGVQTLRALIEASARERHNILIIAKHPNVIAAVAEVGQAAFKDAQDSAAMGMDMFVSFTLWVNKHYLDLPKPSLDRPTRMIVFGCPDTLNEMALLYQWQTQSCAGSGVAIIAREDPAQQDGRPMDYEEGWSELKEAERAMTRLQGWLAQKGKLNQHPSAAFMVRTLVVGCANDPNS